MSGKCETIIRVEVLKISSIEDPSLDDPHSHICWFNKITSTLKYKNVPHEAIKLMLFLFSLEGASRIWLEKEPPRSIHTWEDLQRFDETFSEAWDRFKDLLRKCPHHGFSELHQIDTFYNALTQSDQDSLNAAAGGNLLNRTPRDALTIIENKSKVRTSRNKLVMLLQNKTPLPAPVKAIEETCVICGGPHPYYECLAIDGNTFNASTATGTYNQGGHGYRPQGETNYRASNQMRPPQFSSTECAEQSEPVIEQLMARSALADLGASINLMPLSVWKKLSLPDLTSTRMTLELADRSITRPIGFAEDVFVKVGKFHYPDDFVVVDYDVDPRVPLILGRPFLRTVRALIDVYGEEITLRFNDEAITFSVRHTSSHSYKYDDASVNRIDVIDVTCEEYAQEVLGFSDSSTNGNPTPSSDLIIALSSPSFTPFDGGDFILEEIEDCLINDSIPPRIADDDFDPEGDIRLLEELLNNDSSSPFPSKELHFEELKTIKSSIDDPPELELKDLPSHLEYTFLEETDKLPVIIAKDVKDEEKSRLLTVLKWHKRTIAWKLFDIKGIDPQFCTHKILMEEDFKPAIQHQRRLNPKIHEVIKKEVIKLLDAGLIYPISDSPWLNDATRKDHFSLPFMDQMLERLAGNDYYCFLDGFFGYFQIPIDPQDQEKTTFTCPYETFAYRRMPFGLCNAPGTFQRCMMAIFHNMIEETMEVFMDDFSVLRDSFSSCLSHLDKMLKRCEYTNLVLNWEKCHFMVKEGIVLGHKISKSGIEVDKAKIYVIAKLPHPTSVKGVRSFLGHVGFYRRFIQDFSKIARPMTHLLEKETPFFFSNECIESFETHKKKLTEASILVAPDWDLPFEIMCDASDYGVGAVLGQRKTKHFQPIHYVSKTMTDAQAHYTTTEKELLAVVYAFEKFRPYLVLSKTIVYTDHSALKYLLDKQDVKPRLLRWILLLQEFDVIIRDKKG
ncbi:reverse transcriptase domain-containing protein, partial [Tanacetum coccineum]